MWVKLLYLVLVIEFTYCQNVNNVRLVNHREYMVDVLREVIKTLEQREWCNLKLSDITVALNETVLQTDVIGTVRYKNGFVVSIQSIDILDSSLAQIWAWTSATENGTVTVRGTVRMHDVKLGYDVEADMVDGLRRYTAEYTHPLISFLFSVIRDISTEAITVTVVGTVPRSTVNRVRYMPMSKFTDVFTVLFDPTTTADGILAWESEVFVPITLDVANHRVPFPVICWNCAA